jgi:hypothetical protein
MTVMQLLLLPGMSLCRVTWYLVFQIWISGPPSVSLCWSHGKRLGKYPGKQANGSESLVHLCYMSCCPICLDEVILTWCKLATPVSYTSTFCLGTHLQCMPPVSDTLFGRLPCLYWRTWMAAWYWSSLWLSLYFNSDFSLLISHWYESCVRWVITSTIKQ